MHSRRLNAYELAPAGMNALRGVEAYLQQTTLAPQAIELVKMRASQINRCACCRLDPHSKGAAQDSRSPLLFSPGPASAGPTLQPPG
jgi:AhpD family alkylhydroperoxidase